MKNNVLQLSHGIKNIHQSKFYQQHTHWRKIYLQLPLLTVCELILFRQIKKLAVFVGLYESFLHF